MMACFFFPAGCAGFIYLSHNLSFLRASQCAGGEVSRDRRGEILPDVLQFSEHDGVSADGVRRAEFSVAGSESNNALPLYFCQALFAILNT